MKKNRTASFIGITLAAALLLNTSPVQAAEAAGKNQQEEVMDNEGQGNDKQERQTLFLDSQDAFLSFAEECKLDTWSRDKDVYLDADIDLSGTGFTGIPSFGGSFQGQGHTITGIHMTHKGSFAALFQEIQPQGVVSGIKLQADIQPSGTKQMLGGICSENYGTIRDCEADIKIIGDAEIGGIVAVNRPSGCILNCSTRGYLHGNSSIGGTAGENYGTISNCTNTASVNITSEHEGLGITEITVEDITNQNATGAIKVSDVGGIAGYSEGSISSCGNEGNIGYAHIGYNVGGIVGRQSGYVTACENSGNILGRKDIGGIAGQMEPNGIWDFSESFLNQWKDELGSLQGIINKSISDAGAYGANVSAQIGGLQNPMINFDPSALKPSVSFNSISMNDLNNQIGQINQGYNDLNGTLGDLSKTTSDLLNSLDQLDETQIKSSMSDIMNQMNSLRSQLGQLSSQDLISKVDQDTVNKYLSEYQRIYGQVYNGIYSSFDAAKSKVDGINAALSQASNGMRGNIQSLSNQIFNISDLLVGQMEAADEADVTEDVSKQEAETTTDGKVSSSTNNGKIEGDINVGGITGSMMIDSDLDAEDDTGIVDKISNGAKYLTTCIVLDCENRGQISSKKNCAGAIVGKMDLGYVGESEGYGSVSSNNGDYVGGIVGYGSSSVDGCFTKVSLAGSNYVGGIIGYNAGDVSNCYSLIQVENSEEYLGSVAGFSDGTLTSNYYIGKEIAGVNGIGIGGSAEPMEWQQLIQLENCPEELKHMKVRFLAEDETIQEFQIDYGASIEQSQIPEVPLLDGCQGNWSRQDFENITFDQTVTADYSAFVTALSSKQKRENGLSIILVEGDFNQSAELQCEKIKDDSMKKSAEIWHISIPADGRKTHKIRVLSQNMQKENVEVYLNQEGSYQKCRTEAEGSYHVLEVSGNDVTLAIVEKESSNTGWIISAVIAVAVVLLLLILTKTVLKRRKKKTPEAASEGEDAAKEKSDVKGEKQDGKSNDEQQKS